MSEMPAAPAAGTLARDAALDGLRGISALAIIAWHYGPSVTSAEPGSLVAYANKALSLAWIGVDIFFVLSGFLIGATLLRQRTSSRYFRTFYARRTFRILPLYFVVLVIFALGGFFDLPAYWPASAEAWKLHGVPVWSYPIFAQNLFMPAANHFGSHLLGPTWSLAVEEQFYLIAPLLLFALPRAILPAALIATIAFSAALRLWIGPGVAAYVLLPCRLDGLFLGVLLAWLLASTGPAAWIKRHRMALGVVAAVLFLGVGLPLLRSGLGLRALYEPGGTLLHLWASLCAALLIAVIRSSPPHTLLARFLALAPFRWAGIRAYGLYLLHAWPLYLVFAAAGFSRPFLTGYAELPLVVLAFLITLLLAAASWRWLESPCLNFARRFRY